MATTNSDVATSLTDYVALENLKSRLLQFNSVEKNCGVHAVSFKPSHLPSEDRYFIEDWELPDGTWKVAAIFDGTVHCTHYFNVVDIRQDTPVAKRWTSYSRLYLT